MESGYSSKRKSKVINNEDGYILSEKEQEKVVAEEQPASYNTNKVKLQLRISTRYIVPKDRTISGKRYEWERAGAIVEVDEIDAPGLLAKTLGNKTCCGSSPDNLKVFIRVE